MNSSTVLDFGAVGDGVADDTAAIQASIASLNSAFLPAGVYRITNTITLPKLAWIAGVSREQSIVLVEGDCHGVNTGIHTHVRDLRVRGTSAMAGDKACIAMGIGAESLRSTLTRVVVGGDVKSLGDDDNAQIGAKGIFSNKCFLNNFYSVYAVNCSYGFDSSKASTSDGINNAMHFSGCEFHSCGVGFRMGRGRAIVLDACTFGSNDAHGLILGFCGGVHVNGCYFESNHRLLDENAIRADLIVQPSLVGETDPGASLDISSTFFSKGSFSEYGVYIDRQRNFSLQNLWLKNNYPTSIRVTEDAASTGVIRSIFENGGGIVVDARSSGNRFSVSVDDV